LLLLCGQGRQQWTWLKKHGQQQQQQQQQQQSVFTGYVRMRDTGNLARKEEKNVTMAQQQRQGKQLKEEMK
jgi:hypothetical protein